MTMFRIGVNMRDVKLPGDMGPLPPGDYLCEVAECDLKPTSTPGRSMIKMRLKVVEPADYHNRIIWEQRVLPMGEEDADSFVTQKVRELLDAFPGCFDYDANEGNTEAIHGRQVLVRTTQEEDKREGHKGEMQTRVQRMMSPDGEQAPTEAPAAESDESVPPPKLAPAKKAADALKKASPKPVPAPSMPKTSFMRRPAQAG